MALVLGTACRGSWVRSQKREVIGGLSSREWCLPGVSAVNKLSSVRGWELSVLAAIGVSGPVSFNYTDILLKPWVKAF